MSEHSVSMYATAKDAEIATLRAEVERLRHICSWAAGRLLDAGDVAGHEKMFELRDGPNEAHE